MCSYNRAGRLRKLIPVMREQVCALPYEILIIDNNSSDDTRAVVEKLGAQPGAPVRYVFEPEQGIPFARNRAIRESMGSDCMVFIDDDEIPMPGLLAAADALQTEGAECAGGRVKVEFRPGERPKWLGDELLGFLAAVDHGDKAFWITDRSTPVWTANVAYRMEIFRENPDLRFDARYNRRGNQVGGGSDAIMFWNLLQHDIRIRYRPDMVVEHFVDSWRLRKSYFMKLHFVAGRKYGQYQAGDYDSTLFGVPPFMVRQALVQLPALARAFFTNSSADVRKAMNCAYAFGQVWGLVRRWRYGSEVE